MRRLLLSLLTLFAFLVILIITWFNIRFFILPVPTPAGVPTVVLVTPGMTATQLAVDLEHRELLRDPNYFLLIAKLTRQLHSMKAGEYTITPQMTEYDLLKKLSHGERLLHKITFVEGWNFQQMLEALQSMPGIKQTLDEASFADFMASIGHPNENPEGWFYPDTFFYNFGTKDTKLLRMSYDLMQKKLLKNWQQRAPNLPYKNPYEALIVASMIEKESAVDSERPKIAGVILKRLQMGMPLQIDASVIYGLGKRHRSKVTYAELATDTPYNTYLHKGLPPTPIAMPSNSAIQAALHPEMGTALYYVAKGNGTHVFSDTLQQHNAAFTQYLHYRDFTRAVFLSALSGRCVSARLQLNYWMFLGSKQLLFCLLPSK